ncbi:hypothetical protein FJ364_00585 [Candidatus Dependentiae bacterium]|nr:hypothetical protein [Candidatus Dependentiae bacterium]
MKVTLKKFMTLALAPVFALSIASHARAEANTNTNPTPDKIAVDVVPKADAAPTEQKLTDALDVLSKELDNAAAEAKAPADAQAPIENAPDQADDAKAAETTTPPAAQDSATPATEGVTG